jgi:hypothetical protein
MDQEQNFKPSKKQIWTVISSIVLLLGGETFIGAQIIESKTYDILRPSKNPYFVGFFMDKNTQKLKYKYIDGETYRPRFDEKTHRYYIILDNETTVFCY